MINKSLLKRKGLRHNTIKRLSQFKQKYKKPKPQNDNFIIHHLADPSIDPLRLQLFSKQSFAQKNKLNIQIDNKDTQKGYAKITVRQSLIFHNYPLKKQKKLSLAKDQKPQKCYKTISQNDLLRLKFIMKKANKQQINKANLDGYSSPQFEKKRISNIKTNFSTIRYSQTSKSDQSMHLRVERINPQINSGIQKAELNKYYRRKMAKSIGQRTPKDSQLTNCIKTLTGWRTIQQFQ